MTRRGVIAIGVLILTGGMVCLRLVCWPERSEPPCKSEAYAARMQAQLDRRSRFRHVFVTALPREGRDRLLFAGSVNSTADMDDLQRLVQSNSPPGETVWQVVDRQAASATKQGGPPAPPTGAGPGRIGALWADRAPSPATPAALEPGAQTNQSTVRPEASKLPFYELRVRSEDLAKLDRSPNSNETFPGVFTADGHVYPDVRVRYRGEWARSWPKRSFLARLNRRGATVIKALGKRGEADERDLGSAESYRADYQLETGKPGGFTDIRAFCRELARTKNAAGFFTRHVDVDKYLSYLAATVLIQNWDCYVKNHYLIFDARGSRKWFVVPWDLDRTFGDNWDRTFGQARLPVLEGTRPFPGITGWNRLADRFLSEPALRSRFLDRLEELLEKEFTPEKLFPVLDRLESEIGLEAALDRARWRGGTRLDLHRGIVQVKDYIVDRRSFVRQELVRLGGSGADPGGRRFMIDRPAQGPLAAEPPDVDERPGNAAPELRPWNLAHWPCARTG